MATEKRLIDAYAMKNKLESHIATAIYKGIKNIPTTYESCNPTEYLKGYERGAVETANLVLGQPTVDAVPVVHGHWEKTIDNCTVMHKCSVCGARVVKGFYEYENPNRYCYHCGAKMDGDKDSYGHNADKCGTVTYNGVVLPEPPKMEGW